MANPNIFFQPDIPQPPVVVMAPPGPPGPPGQNGSSAAAGWSTVLDLDLTAQGTQTFTTDTTYTFGGMTWTKGNSANEATHASISGSGLEFQPASGSDHNGGTRTLPYLWLPLSQLAALPSTFDWSTGIRVYASFTQNCAAVYDNACIGIDHNDVTTLGYQLDYGYGTTGIGLAVQDNYDSTGGGFSGKVQSLVSPVTGVLEVTNGLGGSNLFSMVGAGYSAGWPALSSLVAGPRTLYSSATGSITAYAGAALASSFGVLLGAKRAGSSTALAVTYTRLRIDMHG